MATGPEGGAYAEVALRYRAILARAGGEPFVPLLRRSTAWTIVPFSIMASVSLMLAVLWQRSPALSASQYLRPSL